MNKRYFIIFIFILSANISSLAQNFRGYYDSRNKVLGVAGYNNIGKDGKKNAFGQFGYIYNHTLTTNKSVLQLPLTLFTSDKLNPNELSGTPYTLLQPGLVSFLPSLYLTNKSKKYETFAFIRAGLKIFQTDNDTRVGSVPSFVEQGIFGVGSGLVFVDLFEISLEYNYALNNVTTRSTNYFKTYLPANDNDLDLKIISGSFKVFFFRKLLGKASNNHFKDLYLAKDWTGYINTFENENFLRERIGISIDF